MRTNTHDGQCDTCFTPVVEGSGRVVGLPGRERILCLTCRPLPPSRGTHSGWFDGPLAALDFEATGVDPHRDRVVSYALIDPERERESLVDAGVPIPAAAAEVHGITASTLVGAPRPADAIAVVAEWVQSLVDRRIGLVVFNAAYDLTMLRAEAHRHGVRQPQWDRLAVVDPYVIDWGLERGSLGQRRLIDVAAYYNVTLDHAHDAMADARAARDVAVEMGARHRDAGDCTLTELMLRQHLWHAERVDDWNEYAVAKGRDPIDRMSWPLVTEPRVAAAVRSQASA